MKYLVKYFIEGELSAEFEFDDAPFVPSVGDRVYLNTNPPTEVEFRFVFPTNLKTTINVYTKR